MAKADVFCIWVGLGSSLHFRHLESIWGFTHALENGRKILLLTFNKVTIKIWWHEREISGPEKKMS